MNKNREVQELGREIKKIVVTSKKSFFKTDDCREQDGGEGCDGEGSGKPD